MSQSEHNPPASCCSQSPINLVDSVEADSPAVQFNYKAGATQVVHGEYSVELLFGADNGMDIEGRTFALRNVHFHVPGEHRIEGREYLLEAHAVHASEAGDIAVVAVLFEPGAAHSAFEKFLSLLPLRKGERKSLEVELSATAFLPSNPACYRYSGSLTTPPYSEGVSWFVMRETLTLSQAQAEALRRTVGKDNNRPLQALNGRRVISSR
ncbi:MAG: carbonic anhydrase [Gammaproteobacteria bacterium]